MAISLTNCDQSFLSYIYINSFLRSSMLALVSPHNAWMKLITNAPTSNHPLPSMINIGRQDYWLAGARLDTFTSVCLICGTNVLGFISANKQYRVLILTKIVYNECSFTKHQLDFKSVENWCQSVERTVLFRNLSFEISTIAHFNLIILSFKHSSCV